MKNFIFVMAILASSASFAAVEKKEFAFQFKFSGEVFKVSNTAPTWEKAYELAANECFSHFKGKKTLSEDEGLDLIDVCANPRS